MNIALFALFAAAFAIGTSEFVIAGILPAVAGDLQITIPTAGLLISLYALGVAVGGPVLATFTGRFPRKLLLLVYVAIFTVGYVLCAIAPSYEILLVLRVLIALIHGAYFGTAMITATSIVPEHRRGFAVGLILAGLTVANIIGVPIGTAIGSNFGWRMTFWAVSALGVLSFALITFLVPADGLHSAQSGSLRAEFKALLREPVASSLVIILFQTIGQFALFSFISPYLTEIVHIPANVVPWVLLVFGVGSTIGVLAGGRLADWKLMPSLVGILIVMTIFFGLMLVFTFQPIVMAVLILVWGAMAFAFGSPVQTRILNNTRDAPTLAANLIPSAFNIAIALGTWFAGLLIDRGASYGVLPWIGVVTAALATLVALWSARRESRSAATN